MTTALAAESVRIATYYTTMLCTPTRGAFMTGRLPQRLGLHHGVIGGFQDYGLPENETTIADKLKGAGYATAHVGKWHLGNYDDASAPCRRGFDSSYGYLTLKLTLVKNRLARPAPHRLARVGPRRRARTLVVAHPCLLYTSPSPRDQRGSRMPSSA